MGRPKKKEINLTLESVLALMQEVYNELVEQKNTAIRLQNKLVGMMKSSEDMSVLGPVIKEQQKIINDCVDKKLQLSKLQSTLLEKRSNSNQESYSISDIDDDILKSVIEKDLEDFDNSGKYKV